jgi:HK97 family phage major capsid protein
MNLTEANGWLPEPTDSQVLRKVLETSAVEAAARRVNMTSRTVSVPRFDAQGVDAVAEGATIPVKDVTLDEVSLTAIKFANRFVISVEDDRDSVLNAVDEAKVRWASNFGVHLDNAVLGTSGVANGGTVPFTSVYKSVTPVTTAGALSYEDLVAAVGDLESGAYGDDLIIIAHPAFAMELRNLKDVDGLRVVGDPLGQGVPTVFGHELKFSKGARVSATASDAPTGNPLLIVGSKRNLILGVRDGVESALSNEARWETDEIELKLRARRAFKVADASAFVVIEKTA